MKKRRWIALLLVLTTLSLFSFTVSATEIYSKEPKVYLTDQNAFFTNNNPLSSTTEEVILTKHQDGTVTQERFTVNELATTNLVLNAYTPSNEIMCQAMSTYTSPDSHGRTLQSPANLKVGMVRAAFDSKHNDGIIDEYWLGTGSLISYDIILTSAHNVWELEFEENERDGWAHYVEYYAGRESEDMYYAIANNVTMSVPQNYVDAAYLVENEDGDYFSVTDSNYDWCIMQISLGLGNSFGFYGVQVCTASNVGLNVNTIGYPSDKDDYSQWSSPGSIISVSNNTFQYSAYTVSGNSGGPVVNNDIIYGIHSGSVYINNVRTAALATRIYPGFYTVIMNVRAESEARWEH